MCLEVKPDKDGKYICHTAEKDIVCWKAFKTEYGELCSPYQNHKYKRGMKYLSKLVLENHMGCKVVNKGIHSWMHKKSVFVAGMEPVLKCIIPKGSKYYIGNFMFWDSYASDTIIIGKREIKL